MSRLAAKGSYVVQDRPTKWPYVSIVVLNWNGWQDTIECLKSLLGVDYPAFEIITVDNGSTDNSVKEIESFMGQQKEALGRAGWQFSLIRNGENLGFGGGNNAAIRLILQRKRHGRGPTALDDYILLLNNDTTVEPSFLKRLVKVGQDGEDIGILGAKIYFQNERNRVFFAGGKINRLFTRGTHVDYGAWDPAVEGRGVTSESASESAGVDYITGCCLLFKSEIVERIGLMPEDYFLYFEDVDWNLRAHRCRYRSVIVPGARIWHKVSSSIGEGSFPHVYYLARNGLLLARRNAPFHIKLAACLGGLAMMLKQFALLAFFDKKKTHARATIRGAQDFYRNRFGRLDE